MSFPKPLGSSSPPPANSVANINSQHGNNGPSSSSALPIQCVQNVLTQPDTQGAARATPPPRPPSEESLLLQAMQDPDWLMEHNALLSGFSDYQDVETPSHAAALLHQFNHFPDFIPGSTKVVINAALACFEQNFQLVSSTNNHDKYSTAGRNTMALPSAEIRAKIQSCVNNWNSLTRPETQNLIYLFFNGGKPLFDHPTQCSITSSIIDLERKHSVAAAMCYEHCLTYPKPLCNNGREFFDKYGIADLSKMYDDTHEDTQLEYG